MSDPDRPLVVRVDRLGMRMLFPWGVRLVNRTNDTRVRLDAQGVERWRAYLGERRVRSERTVK